MNWFVFVAGLLYIGGAALDAWKGNWPMVGVLCAYAAANFFLMGVK